MAYVLPSFKNAVFLTITKGNILGHLDIHGSIKRENDEIFFDFREYKLKDLHLNYQFTS
jgi:hypothetical protein